MEELAPEQPEVFKALILTLICGLRRSEADAMQWAQVDLEPGTLEIMDTEHRALKSADIAGKIALDAEVVALFRGFKTKTESPFILETPKLARAAFKEHKSRTYRCDATHTALIDWLRKNGVNGKRPMHTMREEVGSVIASRDGISRLPGFSGIQTSASPAGSTLTARSRYPQALEHYWHPRGTTW